MALDKRLSLAAFLITLFLLATILLLGDFFNDEREEYITTQIQETYNNLNEMQTFTLMSEIYGDEMACLAFKSKLKKLDTSLWDLGIKIDQYRVASEEFQKDPFYLQQKKIFNENEVFYLMLLAKIHKHCTYNQEVVSFFYRNSADCKKCDDQSFILTDIKKKAKDEISIFSFDADLNLTTINLLLQYYGITEFPCVVIRDNKYCGIQDTDFIITTLCESGTLSLCSEYRQ